MHLSEGISRLGFRKWYERELLHSHAHLVLLFVCSIGLFGAFSVFNARAPSSEVATSIATIVLFVALGGWSLRRYFMLLLHAEQAANQAVCAHCKTYGRFSLVDNIASAQRLTVRCRKCEHVWAIDD